MTPRSGAQPITLRSRQVTGRALSRVRSAPYLRKWLILGSLIGVVAGVGAVVFFEGLQVATRFLLTDIGGYTPATTAGEGGSALASGFARPWAIPLIVGGGGLIAGLLVYRLAPEAEGHGTDAAIRAVHTNPKGIRPRVIFVKLVASIMTIGSGGSGGREGPTAQISAGFGSVLARVLNLTPADARICVSSGIASGIGAIFRAPFGGAFLGAELLYRDDVEIEALIPSVIATVVAFAVFGSITGSFSPIFGYHGGYQIGHAWELTLFILVGLTCGLVGRLYVWVFYRLTDLFASWRIPRGVKPGVAGLVVGSIGLAIPGVLGTGYGQVQADLDLHRLLSMPLWLVIVVPMAKLLSTGLSIGSGGSGGIFGPGLVIGGSTGAALWRLFHLLGLGPREQVAFVIVGMMACFGSIAHAPFAVTLMVAEMTGNLALLPPAMIAIAFALLVVGDTSIYRSQLRRRSDSLAHRFSFGLPGSSSIPVTDVMSPPRLLLSAAVSARDALAQLQQAGVAGAPVINDELAFIGSVQTGTLATLVEGGADGPVGRLADVEAMTVPLEAALDAAMEALPASKGGWVPVLDDDMRVAGVIAASDLVRGWRLALDDSARRLAGAASSTAIIQLVVGHDSGAVGRPISELPLPAGSLIISLGRGASLISPSADQRLRAGDAVTALVPPAQQSRLRQLLEGSQVTRPAEPQDPKEEPDGLPPVP